MRLILLTAQELETVQLCCSDLTYKQIADSCGVGKRAIDGRMEILFEKFDVTTRYGLIILAVSSGIVDISDCARDIKVALKEKHNVYNATD